MTREEKIGVIREKCIEAKDLLRQALTDIATSARGEEKARILEAVEALIAEHRSKGFDPATTLTNILPLIRFSTPLEKGECKHTGTATWFKNSGWFCNDCGEFSGNHGGEPGARGD